MNKRKGQVMKDGLWWENPPPHLVSQWLLSLYYPVIWGQVQWTSVETIRSCHGEFICLWIEGGCSMVETVCFKVGNSPFASFIILCLLFLKHLPTRLFVAFAPLVRNKIYRNWPRRTNLALILCSDYASSPQSLSGDLQKTVKSTPLQRLKIWWHFFVYCYKIQVFLVK